MFVRSLQLCSYRNYDELNIDFDGGTNILYGNNAQGKTNILEAIYMAATTRSHRMSRDREIVKFDSDEAHIKLMVLKKDVPVRIDIHLKKNKPKGVAVNGIPIKRASELFGILNVVFFSPEDLNIIKSGPAMRRRFMDMEMCQLNRLYVHHLSNYNRIVNQRNSLLREIGARNDRQLLETLDIWDMQMIQSGENVIAERKKFIEKLNSIIVDIHKKLTDGREEIFLKYEPDVSGNNLGEAVSKARAKDIKMKTTTVGPHRDDICIMVGNIDVRKYGSQGQQRSCALSLKLSEIELMKQVINDTPVLLLDDVLSELDSDRQHHLLDSLSEVQTIITCTGLDEFIENRFNIDTIYKVIDGTVEQNQLNCFSRR